jgi:ectoine hydroxylase-related dioxygenase (phytanoyl-CoA dioxygenase family)
VIIEAFQLTEETRRDISGWPKWATIAWDKEPEDNGALISIPGSDELDVMTLEGRLHISLNDWIIRGVKGELYPCKPDIFAATYERA